MTKKSTSRKKTPDERLYELTSTMIAYVRSKHFLENFDLFMSQGASIHGESGQRLMRTAVNQRNSVVLRELLLRGANPHFEIAEGDGTTTLLHLAARKGPDHSKSIILQLVAAGLDPYEKKDSFGMNARMIALEEEGLSQVFIYPLHFAVTCRELDLCAAFLKRGYSPETRNSSGRTPMELAKNKGFKDICAIFDANMAMRTIDEAIKFNRPMTHSMG